jgi:hypothetical protein
MQLAEPERLDAIAEGLGLLAEHVATLREDVLHLDDADRPRGYAVLAAQSEEEAAKALILLDLVRMDWRDHKIVSRQIGRFYNHLARCIYVDATQMRPADFREVRARVDWLRQSHYLDGPNDVDWIFRSQLIAEREDSLYVDYVHEEEGDRWSTPARDDGFHLGAETAVQDLVGALHRTGCTSRGGIEVVARAWSGQPIDDDTHWQEVVAVNRAIVAELAERGRALPNATTDDPRRVIGQWHFPLADIDLKDRGSVGTAGSRQSSIRRPRIATHRRRLGPSSARRRDVAHVRIAMRRTYAGGSWRMLSVGSPRSWASAAGSSTGVRQKGQIPAKPLRPCLLHALSRSSKAGVPFQVCARASLRPSATALLVSRHPLPARCCATRRSMSPVQPK